MLLPNACECGGDIGLNSENKPICSRCGDKVKFRELQIPQPPFKAGGNGILDTPQIT